MEKLHIVQTHVAVLVGAGSMGGARRGLSALCCGDPLPFLEGREPRAGERGWREARFVAFGIMVTFGEDLRNPACATRN